MTQTMQHEYKPPRLGILSVSTDLLEQLLCLPKGYRVIGINFNPRSRTLDFTLMSDALPEIQEYCELPRLSLRFTVETLPGQSHEYRKITPEVIIP